MRDFKIAIILLGRPGSGKDTQAELLAKKFGLIHIVSSKIIEKTLSSKQKEIEIGEKTYDISKEKYRQKSGLLNTFAFVSDLIKAEIKQIAKRNRGLIMSASPRSKTELKTELPLLKKLYGEKNIYFFHIQIYIRNLKRHRKDLPELDTKKIIKKRLKVFNRYTFPVIKLLKNQKNISDINGEQSIMKIHKDILWQLQSKQKKK